MVFTPTRGEACGSPHTGFVAFSSLQACVQHLDLPGLTMMTMMKTIITNICWVSMFQSLFQVLCVYLLSLSFSPPPHLPVFLCLSPYLCLCLSLRFSMQRTFLLSWTHDYLIFLTQFFKRITSQRHRLMERKLRKTSSRPVYSCPRLNADVCQEYADHKINVFFPNFTKTILEGEEVKHYFYIK